VGERVSLFREPDAGNLPVRFDEREQEPGSGQTGLRRAKRKLSPSATGRLKPVRLFSTLLAITLKIPEKGRTDGANLCKRLVSPIDFRFACDPAQR